MRQLHRSPEVSDLARQHDPDARGQPLLDVFRIEEGRGHLGSAITAGDDKVLTLGLPVSPAHFGLCNRVDKGDVLTFLSRFAVLAEHGCARAVLPRIVPKQVVDRTYVEVLLEGTGRLLTDDEVEPVSKRNHLLHPNHQRVSSM